MAAPYVLFILKANDKNGSRVKIGHGMWGKGHIKKAEEGFGSELEIILDLKLDRSHAKHWHSCIKISLYKYKLIGPWYSLTEESTKLMNEVIKLAKQDAARGKI